MTSHNNRTYTRYPRIGIGILVRKDSQYLLIKRGQEPARGLWTVPGGMVELGETLEQAVHREILEECNISVSNCCFLDFYEYISKDSQNHIKFHYVVVDFVADFDHGTLKAGSDVDDAGWFCQDEIKELDTTEGLLQLIGKANS